MSSLTARLGLYKPASTELYNVVTDQTNNWDALDAVIGFVPATSATRPASTFSGMSIRETDTGRLYVSDGSAPASASWTRQIMVVNTPTLSSLSTDLVLRNRVTTDSQDRLQIRADGRIGWGTGAATPDVTLGRSGSASATFTGALAVTGNLRIGGQASHGDKPIPFATSAVTVTGTSLSGASSYGLPFSWPDATRFTQAPICAIASVGGAGSSAFYVQLNAAPTTSGGTVLCINRDGAVASITSITVHVIGVQMTSAAAAG